MNNLLTTLVAQCDCKGTLHIVCTMIFHKTHSFHINIASSHLVWRFVKSQKETSSLFKLIPLLYMKIIRIELSEEMIVNLESQFKALKGNE